MDCFSPLGLHFLHTCADPVTTKLWRDLLKNDQLFIRTSCASARAASAVEVLQIRMRWSCRRSRLRKGPQSTTIMTPKRKSIGRVSMTRKSSRCISKLRWGQHHQFGVGMVPRLYCVNPVPNCVHIAGMPAGAPVLVPPCVQFK